MEKARELAEAQEEIVKKAQEAAREPEPHDADQKQEDKKLGEEEKKLADQTRKAAEEIERKQMDSAELKAKTDDLQQAADTMRKAAEKMEKGEMTEAANLAEQAQRRLERAAGELDQLHRQKLAKALAEAEKEMARLHARQRDVRRDTEQLVKRQANPADPTVRQEVKKIATRQVKVKVELRKTAQAVQELRELARDIAKPETRKEIEQADENLRRRRPERNMDTAVVELTEKKVQRAADEQKQAEDAMEKSLASLQRASDSLAADREAELRRALNEARQIEQSIEKLQPKPQPSPDPDAEPGDEEFQPEPEPQDATGEEGDEEFQPEPEPLTPEQKQDLIDRTAYTLKRFTEHVEQRDFGEQADRKELEKYEDDQTRRQALEQDQERKELGRLVTRMRDRLEAEYQATLRAKKLYSAQRQQCPPKYRHLVNQYYEKLSEMNK
jgi:hypothetical protein